MDAHPDPRSPRRRPRALLQLDPIGPRPIGQAGSCRLAQIPPLGVEPAERQKDSIARSDLAPRVDRRDINLVGFRGQPLENSRVDGSANA